jgi:hypothetical protein
MALLLIHKVEPLEVEWLKCKPCSFQLFRKPKCCNYFHTSTYLCKKDSKYKQKSMFFGDLKYMCFMMVYFNIKTNSESYVSRMCNFLLFYILNSVAFIICKYFFNYKCILENINLDIKK